MDLINVYKYLMGRWKEYSYRLVVIPSESRRGNIYKLKYGKFHLNITLKVTEQCHRPLREVVESPSLEVF